MQKLKLFRNAYSGELEAEINRWIETHNPLIIDQTVAVSDSGVVVVTLLWQPKTVHSPDRVIG